MGLREEKKDRTRTELVRAALELFDEHGFEQTPVRSIADACRVSPATVYVYFPAKEDLVFPDRTVHAELFAGVLAGRDPADGPRTVLLAGVERLLGSDAWSIAPGDPLAGVRGRVVARSPVLRGRALLELAAVQREWARLLCDAFGGAVDRTSAAALTGAVFGAIVAVATDRLQDGPPGGPGDLADHVRAALAALDPG